MKGRNTLVGFSMVVGSIVGVESVDKLFGNEPWTLLLVAAACVVAIWGVWLMVKDIEKL